LLPNIAGNSALAGTPVIAPATHDTGSAVAAIAARDGTAFLSSGTWSLLGTELDSPVITSEAMRLNFTNEGGVNGTTRVLKNVMGLWILQCCRQSWNERGQAYEHSELMELASREPAFVSLIDPDHESFLRPDDMPTRLTGFVGELISLRQNRPAPMPGPSWKVWLSSIGSY
jgi:rhamnulokinase